MNRRTSMLLLTALVFLAGGLFATDSRMTALGYPYGFIRDNSDVTLYPATIFQYNRSVRGELYAPTYYYANKTQSYDWTLNAHMPLKKNIFGVYLNFPTGVDVDYYLYYDLGTKYTGLDISKKIQFYLGLADNLALGFGMAIDSEKTKASEWDSVNEEYVYEYEEKMSASYFELSAGMSTDLMDLGLALYLAGAGAENDADINYLINEAAFSQFGAKLAGRYFLLEESTLDMAAAANLKFRTGSSEASYDFPNPVKAKYTFTEKHSDFLFDAGVGANYKPGPNHNIIFTVKPIRFATEAWKDSDSETDYTETWNYSWIFVPEYTLGLESQIAKWLTGRVGAIQQYVFYKRTYEADTGSKDVETDEFAQYRSSFDMNLGLAFKFGKFTVDTVLSKSLLHDGPDFIGGQTNGLATQVSVNFAF
ncbi:MAG: hypothetical protein K0B87_07215 [Candidatus Syntrophosphaera sp.]|nr:hypothetical protein [Candidatus Syntrophosphaera sp.]